MKFIHAADIHLDSPFLGLQNETLPNELWQQIRESTFTSFTKIIDDAIKLNVDFVLLVGDLFDRADRSVHAEVFLHEQLSRLDEAGIPVVISFGNHDYYQGDPKQLGYPDNVKVLPNQVATVQLNLKTGETVSISGFSFSSQWIHEPMVVNYPAPAATDWNIGMLHGSLATLNSPEANYAPFSVDELAAKHYDYWALGHIHKRQSLDRAKTINYPGNTQGRHINESGPKGYLLVSSTTDQLVPSFHATAPIVWELLDLDLDNESSSTIVDQILAKVAAQKYEVPHFLNIRLTANRGLSDSASTDILTGDMLAAVQSVNRKNWQELKAWISAIHLTPPKHVVVSQFDQDFFNQAQQNLFNNETLQSLAGSLRKVGIIREDLKSADTSIDIFNQSIEILRANISHREETDRDS